MILGYSYHYSLLQFSKKSLSFCAFLPAVLLAKTGGPVDMFDGETRPFKTDYAATLEDFPKAWKPNDWNEIKVRCTGRLPLMETWINGVPMAKLVTAKFRYES